MTQEDKDLLLKDLCGRLPYGVNIQVYYEEIAGSGYFNETVWAVDNDEPFHVNDRWIENITPYLRPMSSMTEEERIELKDTTCPNGTGYFDEQYLNCPMNHFGERIGYDFMSNILDYLNAHHFDYRGLIEMGLALEAPEGMYK